MENQVIFRPRQELQTKDWNNMQEFTSSAIEHVIFDAVADGRFYTGFLVTKTQNTTISVAPGRMYDAGKVYARADATAHDFFGDVPINASQFKKVLISISKSEIEEQVEPRAFLVDPIERTQQTDSVPMRKTRLATVRYSVGSAAAVPVVPATPIDQVGVAVVTLSSEGVHAIEMLVDTRLPQVFGNLVRIKALDLLWDRFGQEIETLRTALAALNNRLGRFVTDEDLMALITRINRIERLAEDAYELADKADFMLSFHDRLVDASTSDAAYSGYDAVVDRGIRFPGNNSAASYLSLFNANDPDVTVVDNFMLPKYEPHPRLDVVGYDAEHRINSYSSETYNCVELTRTRTRVRYGESRLFSVTQGAGANATQYADNVDTSQFVPAEPGKIFSFDGEDWEIVDWTDTAVWADMMVKTQTNIPYTFRARKIWIDSYTEPYTDNRVVTSNVVGQGCAQTWLQSQPGWFVQHGMFLTRKGASGAITVMLHECPDGETPAFGRVIAKVTVAHNLLQVGSGFEGSGLPALLETVVPFPPTMLQAGRRYGISYITGGDHWVALGPDSKDTTVGSFFFAQGGRFNRHPTATTKDLRMRNYYARFPGAPTVYVDLNETTVTGGVEDIDILADQFTPAGTSFRFAANIGGTWKPLSQDFGDLPPANLTTGQSVVKLRAEFNGSPDLMPALGLGSSRSKVVMSNIKDAFKWASEVQDLGSGSTTQNIKVRASLEHFDGAHHTCVAKIKRAGGTLETHDSTFDTVQSDGSVVRTWVFGMGAASQTFQVEITGTTDDEQLLFTVNELYCYAAV